MTRTITRLFDTHTQALGAVDALEAAGVDHDRISIVSNNAEEWHDGHRRDGADKPGFISGMGDRAERVVGSTGDLNKDGENDIAEGAGKGATTGGLLGGGAGLLAGLGMLAIPGLGPVVAAGWLASAAVGAVVGAVAGGATGGLLGALKEAGHTDEEANVYAEGVRRGGTLVSVKADEEDADRIDSLLNTSQAVDTRERADAYRSSGWTQFDHAAEPYSADQVTRERATYGELRSFDGVNPAAEEDVVTEVSSNDPPIQPTRTF